MGSTFSFVGLLFTVVGACLLFFYGLPKKRIGNVFVLGVQAMKLSDSKERDLPNGEWQPIVDVFLKRAALLNRTGFALVALGTVLQMVGVCL